MADKEMMGTLINLVKQVANTMETLALYGLVNPDRELSIKELHALTGVSESTWKRRRTHSHAWANAFFPVGDKAGEFKTTMRKIRQAQDELSHGEFTFRERMAA